MHTRAASVLFVVSLAACSGAVAPAPGDDGHEGSVDGGADAADAGDSATRADVVSPGTKICECCGAHVAWPANESCELGACDGYCNCEPPPTPNNPPGCPDHYVYSTGECSPVGLLCSYPGEGDGSGCARSTAGLFCRGDSVTQDPDAGDAGDGAAATGHWVSTQ